MLAAPVIRCRISNSLAQGYQCTVDLRRLIELWRDVPTHALTLTIPRLLRADALFCVVPGSSKRAAVARALSGPIDGSCPASALRRHRACNLYLEPASAPE